MNLIKKLIKSASGEKGEGEGPPQLLSLLTGKDGGSGIENLLSQFTSGGAGD